MPVFVAIVMLLGSIQNGGGPSIHGVVRDSMINAVGTNAG